MRKAKWVAAVAAAGAVLLVAGCGGEGGADKGGSSSAGSAATGGSGAGGGDGAKLDAAAVSRAIGDAATGAGFTQDSSGEAVPDGLKGCMVTWTADAEKAADPKKSFADTVGTLTGGGWKETRTFEQDGSEIKALAHGTWQLQASNHSAGPLKLVMFVATDAGPECEAAIKADNDGNKKS
ncbi:MULTISPECIES: hypothetical protein [unclassified Streptomyces]|uniref:hypothetical protein n=1 Tax=unclassified Streptomyces TaxID=2593676 RepID=UPI0036E05AA7